MSKRYPGNFITGNPVALSQTSNNGVWDLKDQYHAQNSNTWKEVDGIYEIGKSLRFRNPASAYLNRSPALSSNRTTWTFSGWVKLGTPTGSLRSIFGAYSGTSNGDKRTNISIYDDGTLAVETQRMQVATDWRLYSTRILRDPTAWYHIVVAMDTNKAASQDRLKIYVNGEQLDTFGTIAYPSSGYESGINSTGPHYIGRYYDSGAPSNVYSDHYASEYNFVDGQQLDASYFGYLDGTNGIWMPKKYTGKYGTNGFYLPFSENETLKNLGRNFAGGTNFAPYSESVNSWGNTNCTITSNSTTAPNGTTTADTLAASSTASSYMRIDTGINMGAATYYTMSVYLKAGTATTATLSDGYGTGAWAEVNLSTGAITGTYNSFGYIDASTVAVGNGWYRVILSFITHSSGDYNIGLRVDPGRSYGGTGANGASVYVWGAQINLGKTADAYHPNDLSTRSDSNWTSNNISLTAGTTYDSMVDSPVNVFTSATDVGGTVPGNYPTINPLEPIQSYITYSNGNLSWSQSAAPGFGPQSMTKSTFQLPKTGKWVFAITIGSSGNNAQFGIARPDYVGNPTRAQYGTAIVTSDYAVMNPTGGVVKNGTEISTSSSIGVGDELQCAVDCDAGTVSWYRNGTYLGQATGMATTTNDYWPMTFGASSGSGGSGSWNFGQRPFAYAPPTGFKTLNTTNLQALGAAAVGKAGSQPKKWFDIVSYAGQGGASQTVVNPSGMQPDFIWIKGTNNAGYNHILVDSVKGAGNNCLMVSATSTTATETDLNRGISSFNSNGWSMSSTIGNNVGGDGFSSGITFTGWQWRQSPDSGFNIILYTGNGTSNRAISHNLNAVPKFIMVKSRFNSYNWDIYHSTLGISSTFIANTDAPRNASAFGSTAPTSSNFYTQPSYTNENNYSYVAYVWAEVPGFSKIGSYVSTNSNDGPFVDCGFKPRWILVRSTAGSRDWLMYDTYRHSYNGFPASAYGGMQAWTTGAAYADVGYYADAIDVTANGFKLRNAGSPNYNSGSETICYVAFADNAFSLNNRAH